MDELEEALRVAGVHLDEVESRLTRRFERDTWKPSMAESVAGELVRRALDIPFFERLIQSARAIPEISQLEQPDFTGRHWKAGEAGEEQSSASRAPRSVFEEPSSPDSDPGHDQSAPQRLAAAERALQGRTRSIVVVLDNLVSARNISAVARTSEALGIQELHIIQRQGKPRLEHVFTTGSHRWLDLFWYREGASAIDQLRSRGYRILAADYGEGAGSVEGVAIDGPAALVFGSEQKGVSDVVRERADALFYLPACGFTSYFNVSVAVGISLYTLDRRMREAGLRETLSEEEIAVLRPAWYAMLARGDEARERRYLAWVDRPPRARRD
jgi:tRNA (guanosine-2'-O-)-methyltransferase